MNVPRIMSNALPQGELATELLERRWSASLAAARAKRAECEALLEVIALARASWREAHRELVKLETLRDALAEDLADEAVERCPPHAPAELARRIESAA